MTNRLLLTDVSFYEWPIDFNKMKSAGVKATIVRAGQNLWVDPRFTELWYSSKLAGLWRGSYWFFDSRIEPQTQAKLWIDTMKGDYGELPLFCDFEESYNGNYKGGANLKIFMEEVKKLCPNKELVIYTGYYWFKENVSPSYHDYFKQYSVWLADYDSEPQVPLPFTKWLIWQFDDKGSGLTYGCKGGAVDLNYFNGDEEEFIKRFNLSKLPDVVQPEKDKEIFRREYFEGALYRKFESHPPQGKTLYHVFEIDVSKAEFFVSPQLTSRMYVPKFLPKYNLDIAINGDGFVSTTIAGYAASEGKPYGKRGIESTLYISKENIFTTTPQSPAWNAISYPNLLVQDGKIVKINKTRDDIRGRSALGLTKDHKKLFMVAVDGKDYWSKDGMNFWEVAQILIDLGCDLGYMLDGGGSTTLSVMDGENPTLVNVPCGEDVVSGYSYPMRRVANVFGVRMKTKLNPIDVAEEKPIETILNLKPLSVRTDNKGGKLKYKVIVAVKSRKTPSMYETSTKSISANMEFLSEMASTIKERIPIGGSEVEITWIQMSDGYWIPFSYKGVTYLQELGDVVVVPPVVDSKAVSVNVSVDELGKLYVTITDPNSMQVGKVIVNGIEYK